MAEEQLVREIEQALAELESGNDDATILLMGILEKLVQRTPPTLSDSTDTIEVGEISHSTAIAIGSHIRIDLNQYRLSEEIESRLIKLVKAFERQVSLPPPSNVPAKSTGKEYVERELDRTVQAALIRGNQIAIIGMAGVGKTEMAVRSVLAIHDRFKGSILWFDFGGREDISILRDMANRLGLVIDSADPIERQAERIKRALSQDTRLVIFDDVRNKHLPKFKEIFLPPSGCALIVTSRLKTFHALPLGAVFELDVFETEQAETVFRAVLGNQICNREAQSLDQVSKLCGYLPLAVNVSARHILRMTGEDRIESPIQSYLTELLKRKQNLLTALALPEDELPPEDLNIRAVFQTSYDNLDSIAKQRFEKLGVFTGVEFPPQMVSISLWWPRLAFENEISSDDFIETSMARFIEAQSVLDDFCDRSMLQSVGYGFYRLHSLWREFALKKLRDRGTEAVYEAKKAHAMIYAIHAAQYNDLDDTSVLERDLIEIEAAIEWAEQAEEVELLASLVSNIQPMLLTSGRIAKAQEWLTNAIGGLEKRDDTRTQTMLAMLQFQLGMLELFQGTLGYAEAERQLRESLSIFNKVGKEEYAAVLKSYVGDLAVRRGDLSGAETHYTESLSDLGSFDDSEGRDLYEALMQSKIARLAVMKGDYKKAEALLEKSIVKFDEKGALRFSALSRRDLAQIAIGQGLYDRAERLLEEAYSALETVNAEHDAAKVKYAIAGLAMSRGDLKAAENMLDTALSTMRRYGDRRHEALIQYTLGQVAVRRNDYEHAEELFEPALEALCSIDKYSAALIKESLGSLMEKRGKPDEAEELLESALLDMVEIGNAPRSGRLKLHLAEIALSKQEYIKCEELSREATSVLREVGLQEESLMAQATLARALIETERKTEACELLKDTSDKLRDLGDVNTAEDIDKMIVLFCYGYDARMEEIFDTRMKLISELLSASNREQIKLAIDSNPELLDDFTDLIFAKLIERDQEEENGKIAETLVWIRELLKECRELGIDEAFERSIRPRLPKETLDSIAIATISLIVFAEVEDKDWIEVIDPIRKADNSDEQTVSLFNAIDSLRNGTPIDQIEPKLDGLYAQCWNQIIKGVSGALPIDASPQSSKKERYALVDSINEFAQAKNVPALKRALEDHPELLTDAAEGILTALIQISDLKGQKNKVFILSTVQALLEKAKSEGMDAILHPTAPPELLGSIASRTIDEMTTERTKEHGAWIYLMQQTRSQARAIGDDQTIELADAVLRLLKGTPLDDIKPRLTGAHAECWERIAKGIEIGHGEASPAMPQMSPDPILQVFLELFKAPYLDVSRHIIEKHPELLSSELDERIEGMIELFKMDNNDQAVQHIEGIRSLLQNCREKGLEEAFQVAKDEAREAGTSIFDQLERITADVLAKSSEDLAEWRTELTTLRDKAKEIHDEQMVMLLEAIISLVSDGDTSMSKPNLDGEYEVCWNAIVGTTPGQTGESNMSGARDRDDKGGDIEVGNIVASTNVAIGQNIDISITQGVDSEALRSLFAAVQERLDQLEDIDEESLEDAKAVVAEIEEEAAKGDEADEGILARKFRMIARIGPDIFDVVTATLASPMAGITMVVKKVADKAREDAGLDPISSEGAK